MGTISHYSSDMDILLVGEGDFSFAAALARAFQHAPRLLATSLDSREMLHSNYGWLIIELRLLELSRRGAAVMNEVDVKTLLQNESLSHLSFDRIVYNFPHSGFVSGLNECTEALIRKHRQLMQSFFKNIRAMLKVGGEVHVAHHMWMPYSKWRLEEEAAKSGLQLRACYKFEAQVFPGYTPRRGAGANANGTFPLHNPVTFIFFLPYSPPPYAHHSFSSDFSSSSVIYQRYYSVSLPSAQHYFSSSPSSSVFSLAFSSSSVFYHRYYSVSLPSAHHYFSSSPSSSSVFSS